MSFTVYLPDKREVDLGPSFDVIARLAELGRIDPSDRYGALMGLIDASGEELNRDYTKQIAQEAGQFQAEYNQRLSPPLRAFLGELSLLTVGEAKGSYVHPYTREGHPVSGYWRDDGAAIPRGEFVKLLDELPIGTRFTLSPASTDAGYWAERGTWEKVDLSGITYWYNAERGQHRTSTDFHATAGPVLDALKLRRPSLESGKRHPPSAFIAPPETAVARGTIRHVGELQPSPLLQREIDRGFKNIDSVHSVKIEGEPPPKIPILSFDNADDEGGSIQIRSDDGVHYPEYIRIPEVSSTPVEMAIPHEFGHYLDSQIFGKRENFGSRQAVGADGYGEAKYDHQLRNVMDTIATSAAVARLIQMMRSNETFTVRYGNDPTPTTVSLSDPEMRAFTEYLVQPEELFARAYAQYIGTKSNNEKLNTLIFGYSAANGQLHPQQWNTDDFAPISAAFDKLFSDLGWAPAKMAA